ncbi:YdcF family protein [Phyllobacterium sp. LjRoot231]|uniref:YdcF family protein n=1 Tax=Phyllobacterium sp. LjRoot231 TaxID=3342289 RepID=UPI003ECED2C2
MQSAVSPAVLQAARTLWDFHLVYDELSRADLIIGLGSYDLRVADRCAELFHQGLAKRILFTGKSGNWTGGLYEGTEAEAFAARANELGVPDEAILVEPQATNIGENIRFSRAMAGDEMRRIIIVTKPQTQRRVYATVRAQWPDIEALVTAPPTGFEDQPTEAYPLEMFIHEMVGDVQRMVDYPAKGFQIAQSIPRSVADAFDFLVKEGYHHHL